MFLLNLVECFTSSASSSRIIGIALFNILDGIVDLKLNVIPMVLDGLLAWHAATSHVHSVRSKRRITSLVLLLLCLYTSKISKHLRHLFLFSTPVATEVIISQIYVIVASEWMAAYLSMLIPVVTQVEATTRFALFLLVEENVTFVPLCTAATTMTTATTVQTSSKLEVKWIELIDVPIIVAFDVKLVVVELVTVLLLFFFLHLVRIFFIYDFHIVIVVHTSLLMHVNFSFLVHDGVVTKMGMHLVLVETIVAMLILVFVVLTRIIYILLILKLMWMQTLVVVKQLLVDGFFFILEMLIRRLHLDIICIPALIVVIVIIIVRLSIH